MILACKNPSFLNAGNALAMAQGKDGLSVIKAIVHGTCWNQNTRQKKCLENLENVGFPRNLSNGSEDILSLIHFFWLFDSSFFTSIFNQIKFLKFYLNK